MSELSQTVTSQINKIQEDCAKIEPLVCIRCITFNHEPYIRDALEGFVMQKTDFPFVAIVHDDVSTDATADIIREYAEKFPDIIKPIFETENQYSKKNGSLTSIMNKACDATGAKYIAMCEGDDYWTDPLKLQKQVDFLESHPEYGMCYTKVRRYDQVKRKFIDEWGGPHESFKNLLISNTVPTLSVLIRSKNINSYTIDIKQEDKNWQMGDYPKWLYTAAISKIQFMSDNTGVYRILNSSASHSTNLSKKIKFITNYREIALYFAKRYNSNLVSIINDDIRFWKYAYDLSVKNKINIKYKFRTFIHEKRCKKKLLILLSILSCDMYKLVLSKKI